MAVKVKYARVCIGDLGEFPAHTLWRGGAKGGIVVLDCNQPWSACKAAHVRFISSSRAFGDEGCWARSK